MAAVIQSTVSEQAALAAQELRVVYSRLRRRLREAFLQSGHYPHFKDHPMSSQQEPVATTAEPYTLRHTIRPGDIGAIVRFHGILYEREYGFDPTFEAYVAEPLGAFVISGGERGRIWIAEREGELIGCIAIVAAWAGWMADRLIARGRDAVRVRKSFIVAGYAGATTVLLGAHAPTLGMALFWNVLSLSLLGLVTANILALCKLTLIPKQAVGLNTGLQQVATSLAGGVSASLSGWLLHVGGSYELPMMAIFGFLVLGATAAIVLLRREWAPRVNP